MRFLPALILSALAALTFAPPANAAMYSYVDDRGVRHYSNAPGDARYKKVEERAARPRGSVVSRTGATAAMKPEDRLLRTIASRSISGNAGRTRTRAAAPARPQGKHSRQLYDLFFFDGSAPSAPGPTYKYSAFKYGGFGFGPRYTYHTPREINEHVEQAARLHRLDPMLIKAVIKTESNFNPYALSPKGAQGLMQLMPGTAREMNVHDAFDVRQNVFGGARYLRQMLNQFGGDVELALAAYNAGPNRVAPSWSVPNIPETRSYVAKVMRHYRAYQGGRDTIVDKKLPERPAKLAAKGKGKDQKDAKEAKGGIKLGAPKVVAQNTAKDDTAPAPPGSIKVKQLVTVQ